MASDAPTLNAFFEQLGPIAGELLVWQAERMAGGTPLGDFDQFRDYLREGTEELLDGLNYFAAGMFWAMAREEKAETESGRLREQLRTLERELAELRAEMTPVLTPIPSPSVPDREGDSGGVAPVVDAESYREVLGGSRCNCHTQTQYHSVGCASR